MSPPPTALVVGAGPAGLMAAETLAARGAAVTMAEAMPSPARKFLMAGKSGLNLTHDAPPARIAEACAEAAPWLAPALAAFGPAAIRDWAEGLGQPLFTGSSGRVFPRAMKASPLLRAWLARLDALGVRLLRRHRLVAFGDEGAPLACRFETPGGSVTLRPDVVVLALGGASWSRLGSDGRWTAALAAHGVECVGFRPANVALSVEWSAHMTPHFGAPLKPLGLSSGGLSARGEAVISARGLEGGGVYAVSRGFRAGAPLIVDLAPDLAEVGAAARLAKARRGDSASRRLAKALGLDAAKRALLQEFARPLPQDPEALAALVKALPVPGVPRPLDEAISTAGGLPRAALGVDYELRALPGVFAAGEMLDWEAPTGGHLLTACLATGRAAGAAAAGRLGLPPG